MFIDDNPMNLAEAQHFAPGLQVSDPSITERMLSDPLFRGKDDIELRRLAQYKVLERRKADESVAIAEQGGSNVEFLRVSNVRVAIELDVEKHLDRAIELIDRTNQLNFTRRRLSENPLEARRELQALLNRYDVVAGLVPGDRYLWRLWACRFLRAEHE